MRLGAHGNTLPIIRLYTTRQTRQAQLIGMQATQQGKQKLFWLIPTGVLQIMQSGYSYSVKKNIQGLAMAISILDVISDGFTSNFTSCVN